MSRLALGASQVALISAYCEESPDPARTRSCLLGWSAPRSDEKTVMFDLPDSWNIFDMAGQIQRSLET